MYRTAPDGTPSAAMGPSHTVHGGDLGQAFERLRLEEGIQRISAIGGRVYSDTARRCRLIQDIYLTTTSLEGGEPGTPWYCGSKAPRLTAIATKQWHESGSKSSLTTS